MAENVRVAVRVRPFNTREIGCGSKLVIRMNGQQTIIKNPKNGEDKKFAFDYSYWSHDGFSENKDGYYEPTSSRYADQMKVFNDLGRGVLDNAWKGYNCSLFAYGQTGSGKSYSMIGYKGNKGIVPAACEDLFCKIDEKRSSLSEGEEFRVSVSMIEIYSEQVRDLLTRKAVTGGMKIREDPKKGFYVMGLKEVPVNSFKEIESQINEGSHNRTVAATNMNATSSRAHTIVAINFTQKTKNGGQSMTKTSTMNLVDLAGSERAASTGATGDRLKEGAAINQSLSSLGNCINALASGKGKVPFRDSALTRLLKNALGGNSKTIMIAALSPADINYDETLSTLRFADRAKSIKTKAVVNESPTDKLIRELREENARLMAQLKAGGGGGVSGAGDVDGGSGEEVEELLRKNREEMEAMEKEWADRLAQAQAEAQAAISEQQQENERKKNVPHLWNLNEDAALSGMIVHFCDPGQLTVGREGDIQLKGVNILTRHAVLKNTSSKVTITPVDLAKVFVNGKEIQQETQLHHHDRVLFGTNHLFVFHHPVDFAKQQKAGKEQPAPTFEEAQEEVAQSSGIMALMGDKAASRSKEDLLLMDDLIKLYPQVQEANAMSEELDRRAKFEIVLISPQGRGLKEGEGRTEVYVSLTNYDSKNEFFWSKDKFSDRKFMMQEMYQKYVNGEEWQVPQDQDPFWEPADTPILIGTSHLYLQSLSYMIEIKENFSVTDFRGEDQGKLQLELRPCDETWTELEDDFIEPEELPGKLLNFKLKIKAARDLSPRFAYYYVQYKFYLEDEFTCSPEVKKTGNPEFNFEKKYSFKPVTKQFVEYLQHSYVILELWGKQRGTDKKINKTTKELMSSDKLKSKLPLDDKKAAVKQRSKGGSDSDLQQQVDSLEMQLQRSQKKIQRMQQMLNDAKKNGKETIDVDDLDAALSSNQRPPSMAQAALAMTALHGGFGGAPEVAKRRENALGKNTSSTCVMQ